MVNAEVIRLYSIFSHVKYNLLYILEIFAYENIYFFQIHIIYNEYFPCILLLFI